MVYWMNPTQSFQNLFIAANRAILPLHQVTRNVIVHNVIQKAWNQPSFNKIKMKTLCHLLIKYEDSQKRI